VRCTIATVLDRATHLGTHKCRILLSYRSDYFVYLARVQKITSNLRCRKVAVAMHYNLKAVRRRFNRSGPDPPSGAVSHIPDARSGSGTLTTAMQYWSAFQPTWYAVCSRCSTRRHDSSIICDHTTTSLMRWRHCTGCASQNACSTKSRC